MGALITLLLCALGFFIYLTDKNNKEIERLKNEAREKETVLISPSPPIGKVRAEFKAEPPTTTINNYTLLSSINNYTTSPIKSNSSSTNKSVPLPSRTPPLPSKSEVKPVIKPYESACKRFVQVIFKKSGKKRYDYFLGDIDVKVGDFVVVYVSDKFSGKNKWKIGKVMYISLPGEVSPYAKSEVIKKADYDKW